MRARISASDLIVSPKERCWLARLAGAGPCGGRRDRAHLIPQQILRRELGAERGLACERCGAQPGEPCRGRRGPMTQGFHGPRMDAWWGVVWDPRVWVPGCRKHHERLDHARTLKIPRWWLPAGVEEFAAEHALEWWLAREYGERAA